MGAHRLGQKDWVTGELAANGIETLSYQSALPHADHPSRCEIFTFRFSSRCDRNEAARRGAIQRTQPDGLFRAVCDEQELPSAGEKTRCPVDDLPLP
jgi:hypothetical protein